MSATRPATLVEVAAALESAAPPEMEEGAGAFDDARRGLRTLAGRLERLQSELEDAWQGAAAAGARLDEPLRRTRRLLHQLDENECGRHLRVAAGLLADGQTRVRDLIVQRASGLGDLPYDQQAQQVLSGVADGYRDVGHALGGRIPPPPVPVEEPGSGRRSLAAALDGSAPARLAATDPAQVFRPVAPASGLGQPGDAIVPPAGAGGAGGGAPMMPFMPPMGGGMGGPGGQPADAASTRRPGLPGEPGAWGGNQREGWDVIGRADRIEAARDQFRKDFDDQIAKVTRGDRDV
uniref:hypothetical protein n=1 Tax=Paractinoplanes polyasparticus TaxID=2856853 RepID=UPI001C84BB9A|nr:hypothetical protein [Actinoplanes polyasparticus]